MKIRGIIFSGLDLDKCDITYASIAATIELKDPKWGAWIEWKRGTIMGMVDRYLLLSHPRYYDKNLKFTINILLENDYPPEFWDDKLKIKNIFSQTIQSTKQYN